MGCKHEYGSYKGTRQLWCSDCGVELDLITRKPKDGEENTQTEATDG
jgi:hypothetical protein